MNHLFILISSRRIAAARLGRDGAIAASASRSLGAPISRDAWTNGLQELDAPLQEVLGQLGRVRLAQARVIYRGTESVSELVRVPTSNALAAREATALALSDVAAFQVDEHASDIITLQRREGTTLCLGAADRAEHLDALTALLGRAGIRVGSFCPLAAAMIAGLARRSETSGAAGAELHVHIGEDQTTLLTRHQGVIELAREVDFGLVHVVDALANQLRRVEGDGAPSPSAAEHAALARTLLHERGLATSGRREGTLDRSCMVAIQPALQRLVVEVRQTLRFGFGDGSNQNARIFLHGPATRVPHLGDYLCEVFSDEIRVAPSGDHDLDIECALAGRTTPTLLPPATLARRAVSRVRRLSAAGAAVALGLVALEYESVTRSLAREQVHAAETSARLADARQRSALLEQARAEETRVALNLASLRSTLGLSARLAPALEAVALASPAEIRLTDLRLADSQSGPGLTLDGVVVGGNERAAADVLRAFVRSLESDAAFASVRLGATRAVRVDGEPAQKFTIDASLTSVHAFAFEETQ